MVNKKDLQASEAYQEELTCVSCQENIEVHPCPICEEDFEEGDSIYCEHHSQTDCVHYHRKCIDKKIKTNTSIPRNTKDVAYP